MDWRQKVMYITHARRLFVLSLQFRAKGKVLERKKKYKKIYIKRRDEGKSYKVKKKKKETGGKRSRGNSALVPDGNLYLRRKLEL